MVDLISVIARKRLLVHHQMDTTRFLGLPDLQCAKIYETNNFHWLKFSIGGFSRIRMLRGSCHKLQWINKALVNDEYNNMWRFSLISSDNTRIYKRRISEIIGTSSGGYYKVSKNLKLRQNTNNPWYLLRIRKLNEMEAKHWRYWLWANNWHRQGSDYKAKENILWQRLTLYPLCV